MPYNFVNQSYYEFDYKNIYSILKTDMFPKKYLNNWKQVIKNIYAFSKSDNHLNNIPEFIFQQIFHFDNGGHYYLHFNIDVFDKYYPANPNKGKLPLTEFFPENKWISYTPTRTFNSKHTNSNKPIYVVQFFSSEGVGFVVDGNHRLTAKISKNKTQEIDCCFFAPVESEFFPSVFDHMMYLINYELNFLNKSKKEGKDINEIIKYSALYTLLTKFL